MQFLYHKTAENAVAQKILATAAYLDVSLIPVPSEENKAPSTDEDFLDYCDPCGDYPVLEMNDGSGSCVFGANAILRYVARMDNEDTLHAYGRTPFEASQVDMWIDFSGTEIDTANRPYLESAEQPARSRGVPDSALASVRTVLSALEEVLSVRTFLVGERMTIADIAVAFSIQLVYRCNTKHGNDLATEYPAVYRHYNTVMRNPKIWNTMRKEGATLGPKRS